jgi:hypothetical protein
MVISFAARGSVDARFEVIEQDREALSEELVVLEAPAFGKG